MSGVYIRGVEMPESCAECLNIGWQYVFECNLDDVDSGARLGSCPLIPVPDHGRLIEEDAAYDKIAEEAGEEAGNYVDMDVVGRGLENTPTIIPADKEET